MGWSYKYLCTSIPSSRAGVTSRRSLSSTSGAGARKANSMAMRLVQLGADMCLAALVCMCVVMYLVEETA